MALVMRLPLAIPFLPTSRCCCVSVAVVVARGAFRVYRATARGAGKPQRLRLRVRDYVIALAVPVLVAAVLYAAPSILSPWLDWRFILLWGPSSVLAMPIGIILLAFVLTLDHQIKRILLRSKEWGMSNISLYCLPYSGGSAAMYYKWRSVLSDNITLRPLEPAGRGREYASRCALRWRMPSLTSINNL